MGSSRTGRDYEERVIKHGLVVQFAGDVAKTLIQCTYHPCKLSALTVLDGCVRLGVVCRALARRVHPLIKIVVTSFLSRITVAISSLIAGWRE